MRRLRANYLWFRLILSIVQVWALEGEAQEHDGQIFTSVELEVGEVLDLGTIEPGHTLTVSRKGIVDVQVSVERTVTLVALRRGFVLVKEMRRSAVIRQWKVTVHSDQPQSGTIPLWICEVEGIICDSRRDTISGHSRDFVWFHQARAYCQRSSRCHFRVNLQVAEKILLSGIQSRLGNTYRVTLKGAILSIQSPCQGTSEAREWKKIETILSYLPTDAYAISCAPSPPKRWFRLTLTLVMHEKSTSREQGIGGFDWDNLISRTKGSAVSEHLEDQYREMEGRVLGFSSLQLQEGGVGKTVSGGEFAVQGPEQTLSWKETGLHLTVSLGEVHGNKVVLKHQASLRRASEGGAAGRLSVHSLEGEASLQLGKESIIGLVDFTASNTGYSAFQSLRNLPIIGPLFRLTYDGNARSVLATWCKVDVLDPVVPE